MAGLRQQGRGLAQGFGQGGFQGVGRVDHKHPAGWQARANHFTFVIMPKFAGLDGECGVQPGATLAVGQGFELAWQVLAPRAAELGTTPCMCR